jgi:hypothetical protein
LNIPHTTHALGLGKKSVSKGQHKNGIKGFLKMSINLTRKIFHGFFELKIP